MSELRERAKELARQFKIACHDDKYNYRSDECMGVDLDEAQKLIEQALLAERRLALEEAAQIVDGYWIRLTAAALGPFGIMSRGDMMRGEVAQELAQALRAAAEKEVVK